MEEEAVPDPRRFDTTIDEPDRTVASTSRVTVKTARAPRTSVEAATSIAKMKARSDANATLSYLIILVLTLFACKKHQMR